MNRRILLALLGLLFSASGALADGLLVSPCGKAFCGFQELAVSPPAGAGAWPPATVISNASVGSTTGGTTSQTVTVTAGVGAVVFLQVTTKNSAAAGTSPITTVSDPQGNTWTTAMDLNNTGGTVSDGISMKVFRSTITNALSATVLTINFSGAVAARGVIAHVVTAAGAVVVQAVGAGVCTSGVNPQTTGNVPVDQGATIVGMASQAETTWNGLDADTTNGTWSAGQNGGAGTGASGSTSASQATQFKQATATGNQSWDITKGVTPRHCISYVLVHG